MARLLREDGLSAAGRAALADIILSRAGKVLSGDNEACLRAAHDHMRAAADSVASVVAQNYDGESPDPLAPIEAPPASEDADRATRSRLLRQAQAAAALAVAAEA
jgi:hypothetical protein